MSNLLKFFDVNDGHFWGAFAFFWPIVGAFWLLTWILRGVCYP